MASLHDLLIVGGGINGVGIARDAAGRGLSVMLHGVLESIALLADAMLSFDERCARGIEPLREAIEANVERSLMLVTALNPHIGYENAAKIALKAHREGTSLREAALALGLVDGADFDRWVDPAAMTRPGD